MEAPPIPDTFERFLPWFARRIARLVQAESAYSGVERLRESDRVAGAAEPWSGRMLVGRHVPELVELMLRKLWPLPSPAGLQVLRETIATLVHECTHLAMHNGHDRDPWATTWSRRPPTLESQVFLEEGVTEATTRDLLPGVLPRFEPWVSGIGAQMPDRSWIYPNYVPATRELLLTVQALPEMRDRDALMELAGVPPERKLDLLVEQAMDGFGLTYNVPARERADVRERIRDALERHVQRNRDWMVPRDRRNPGRLNTREPAALSTIMGRQMSLELQRQLHLEGERVDMLLPEGWRRRLVRTELDMASKAKHQKGLEGPEAQAAIQRWRAEASGRQSPRRTAGVGERWLRLVGSRSPHDRRRVKWHQGRELIR